MIEELVDKINNYLDKRKKIKDSREKHFKMRQDNFDKRNVTLTGTIATNDVNMNGNKYDLKEIANGYNTCISVGYNTCATPLKHTSEPLLKKVRDIGGGFEQVEIEPGLYTTNYVPNFSSNALPKLEPLPNLAEPLELDDKATSEFINMIKSVHNEKTVLQNDVLQQLVKLKEGKLIVDEEIVDGEVSEVTVNFVNGQTKVFHNVISFIDTYDSDGSDTWVLECKGKDIHIVKRNVLYIEEEVTTD